MGAAIKRRAVKQLAGRVWVEPELGQAGCNRRVRLDKHVAVKSKRTHQTQSNNTRDIGDEYQVANNNGIESIFTNIFLCRKICNLKTR